jgi:hypothetical protein
LTDQDLQLAICRQWWSLGSLTLIKGQLWDNWCLTRQHAFRNYVPWRSGQQWAVAVIMKLRALLFTLWENRNTILHKRQQENHPDIDPDAIDLDILEEWTIGPHPDWSHGSTSLFKGITCKGLLSKPLPQ